MGISFARIACLSLFIVVMSLTYGCASVQSRGYVSAPAWAANYTEDYIQEFWVLTESGQRTGLEGIQVSEFSRGGTSGGHMGYASVPGVGQTIKVVWRVGGHNDAEATWKTFSKDVVVKGETSNNPETGNFLIIRFFPQHEVEAEFVWEWAKPYAKSSPRVDQLFYGHRVMRQLGE
ncbi:MULTISPECIES: DUF3304 domain-containing protein [unclassified Paraburkholderia]|uniref:DUF3304 domain-containing protein n=1 Tax=unclassified Paraburkholderia TaxID=2615204 RepID=UPI0009477D7B|nr:MULTISPECIES: DUF3304 domain-containing protein [unclassified Paraburkholderia]APR34934.1 hypothetical protein BTO02_05300 [Paraburkholderia sp. SOS3]MDQ7982523.1 DUF3304 domain-containing protein [Paraburkholderia sp. SARCC-3016]